MANAAKAIQFDFSLPDKVGLLAEISAALAGAKVNILSICAYAMEGKAHFLITVDSPAKARKALAGMGVTAQENAVLAVEMPNRPGELEKVARRLAEKGINIQEMYGTTSTGRVATCIFKVAEPAKAVRALAK